MKSERPVGLRNNVGRACGDESRVTRLRGDPMLGDAIFVKINGCIWWPGQVVDENNVSDTLKPQSRLAGEILVRLYGSYEYLYVDSMKCTTEFEIILKQNSGSYSEIFRKALEQDLTCIKSARKLKRGGSNPRGKSILEASKVEKLKQYRTRRTREADVLSVTEETPRKYEDVGVQGTRAVKIDGVAKNSRAGASVRASPRRQRDINTSQKRVKSGELLSRKAGEEASKNDTPKQDLVQKKLEANNPNSARGSPRRHVDNNRLRKRVKRGELISRKAGKEDSKNDTLTQKPVQKKRKANSPNSAGVSPRKQPDDRRTRKSVKNRELASTKAREEASKNDTQKQELVLKKLKAKSPNSARDSSRRQQDNSITRKRLRSGELISRKTREEASKNDNSKQDVVQKKLKSNSPNSARGSSKRQLGNSRTQKRLNSGVASRKAREGASENDTPKQALVQKKLRANSPNSVLSASGKSQSLSERRMRVMQSLGLIAPSGSPFHNHKNRFCVAK